MITLKNLKINIFLLILLCIFSNHAIADEFSYQRVAMEAQKKVQIARYMKLSGQQDADFWGVYSNYERDLGDVYRRKFDLISEFRRANSANQITDNKAAKMLDEYFSLENEKLMVKQKYIPEFRKILPNRKVTLFYQIDNKLDAIVNHEIAMKINLLD